MKRAADKPHHLLVIANPAAGRHTPSVKHLEAALQKHSLSHDLLLVHSPEQAAESIKQARIKQYEAVAVFGGDSTAAAVIKAVDDALPILALPGGTSNVIAGSMGSSSISEPLRAFAQGQYVLRYLHIATAAKLPFVLDFHFGLFAVAVHATPQVLKRWLGTPAYQVSAGRHARTAQKHRFTLEIDGKTVQAKAYACFIINNGNKRVFGVRLWPKQRFGHLRVLLVKRKSPWALVKWYVARLLGRRNLHNVVAAWHAEKVTVIEAPNTMHFDDQRLPAALPMTASYTQRSVRIISPARRGDHIEASVRWLRVSWYRYRDQLQRIVTGVPSGRFSRVSKYLYIGGQYNDRALAGFEQRGIRAIVNMRTKNRASLPKHSGFKVLHLATVDMTAPSLAHLEKGVTFIETHVAAGNAVYVHCRAGHGRGPTMAAAYLISTGMRPGDAIAHIKRYRPFARPNKQQVQRLMEFAEHVTRNKE